jgi:uncharacterized protein
MKKLYIISIFLLIVIFLFIIFFNNSNNQQSQQACINLECFNLEIAQTQQQRQTGLMHRTTLSKNNGMLFIFPNLAQHTFWMKNTLIPLDIIWIDSKFKIIHIENNVQPCNENPCPTYFPDLPSKYVLEINSNLTKQYNIKIGDTIKFQHFQQ